MYPQGKRTKKLRVTLVILITISGLGSLTQMASAEGFRLSYAYIKSGSQHVLSNLHPRKHHEHFFNGFAMMSTAELIGVRPDILVKELATGKTLLDVVRIRKNWSEGEFLSKLETLSSSKLSKAVQDGKLTNQQADRVRASLKSKLKRAIHHRWDQDRTPPRSGHSRPFGIPFGPHHGRLAQWEV